MADTNRVKQIYDKLSPSIFVEEFLHPEKMKKEDSAKQHPNANKRWTRNEEYLLLALYHVGKNLKQIAEKWEEARHQ